MHRLMAVEVAKDDIQYIKTQVRANRQHCTNIKTHNNDTTNKFKFRAMWKWIKRKNPFRRKHHHRPVSSPPLPPPPHLPGARRFSIATAFEKAPATPPAALVVPVVPVQAFEIIPGAEDIDDDADLVRTPEDPHFRDASTVNSLEAQQEEELDAEPTSSSNMSTPEEGSGRASRVESTLDITHLIQHDGPNGGHIHIPTHSSIAGSSTSSPGTPMIVTDDTARGTNLNLGNALMNLLSTRRKSTCSWTEEVLYDEAEVRSALHLASPPASPNHAEIQAEVPLINVSGFQKSDPDIRNKRLVMVALDKNDAFPVNWVVENTLKPDKDLIVLVHVRPVVSVPETFSSSTEIEGLIEENNKIASHSLLKTQIKRLQDQQILVKAIALRGDPRVEILRKVQDLDVDLLVLGSYQSESAQ
ncbi:hypothetical protein HDV05_008595, partial [Chytridiales sp. JEL 0842]